MILKFACEKEPGYTLPFNFLAAKSTEYYLRLNQQAIRFQACCRPLRTAAIPYANRQLLPMS